MIPWCDLLEHHGSWGIFIINVLVGHIIVFYMNYLCMVLVRHKIKKSLNYILTSPIQSLIEN